MKKKQKFSNYELPFIPKKSEIFGDSILGISLKFQRANYHLPEAGFTLMELMVVIAIIVLLAGIMTPNVARRLERAKMTRAEADIAAIENAIAMYENDTGRYPEDTHSTASWDSIDVLAWRLTAREPDGTPEPLISNDRNWHGPYIKGIDEDSWKEYYVYMKNEHSTNPPTQGTDYPASGDGGSVDAPPNLGYYIYSMGKNKKTGTIAGTDYYEDDVNNWDVKKSWREEY
ncbi:type II secretion system protein GspG [bacterium]|nr:type II secretion system protein GspG [bacterium]